ncbi:hypothetical protein F1C10_10015 [Sphingomonas sp. NBWT7]|uniref:hypothetical protein n=1 Tax=unclassified Sphingomonas TaxID=196159 RepID=UPI000A269580|nr:MULTISPECIES: hypothetical protein [unclassified Sphingomonas]QNE32248.1 hypothetical protein F1C10_10015 [Sphingomonas sp. NBWT7]
MDTATGSVVERIARVLAGQRISANADGDQESASGAIDATWRDYRNDALAVLHTLRAPSEAMASVGDTAAWERMILAAIDEGRPENN